MKNIYLLGSINIDLTISAPRLPKKGETIVGKDFMMAFGGKGLNQAIAAKRLGGNVIMCGCIGNDTFGDQALSLLKHEGIDVCNIKTIENLSTGIAVITLFDNNNSIIISPGANYSVTKDQIDAFLANAKQGDYFITQLENNLEMTGYAIKMAKQKRMFVILNPAPVNEKIVEYFSYIDMIIPNETELELLGGEEKLKKLVPNVIITLGGKGYKIINKEINKLYPCNKIIPVDTVGAGDTFTGGVCCELSLGNNLVDACTFASKAASIACTKKGASQSIPSRDEVNKYKFN